MATNAPSIIESLAKRIPAARAETDGLFALLSDAELYERPIPERHRLIFYLGHIDAFDWNQICRGALGMPSFHPTFDKLFEFGIDPAPGTATEDQPSDWPESSEIRGYCAEIRRRLDRVLPDAPEQIVHVALEHRLMHAETLSYLLRELRPAIVADTHNAILDSYFVEVPKGIATLGQRPGEFGWDNEFRAHTVEVPAFAISKYKVTNREYLRFVEDGGPKPHFWDWPLNWPVYCTHDQASAYAAWAGKALPTEAQFHRAAYGTPSWGVAQLVAHGWEWTSTVFAPFPGFEPFPFYPGYSANFFDGQHFVLKGGDERTAPELLRPSFRNWFRHDYPYVPATFRLVEAA